MIGRDGRSRRLRVAIVAGTLGSGGAEKQLVYVVGALQAMGTDVMVYSLTRGEYHEPELTGLGVHPVWIGRRENPALRVLALAAALRAFRPHIVQSSHFYTNLYASLVAPLYGAIGIGAARSDIFHEVAANGRWGPLLLRLPASLLVNSQAARRNAVAHGVSADDVHVLPNVIDLAAFDEFTSHAQAVELPPVEGTGEMTVVGVGSLVPVKRFDRFLQAIALARAMGAPVRGLLAGDGPERPALETLARELGLFPDGVFFAGRRTDIPALLHECHIFALTSDHEGFPNVLLEAMAAGLPTVTTPAGDAGVVVEDGVTGFVVPPDDVAALAARLVALAGSEELRARLGSAGRRRVETCYASDRISAHLTACYRAIALRLKHRRTLDVLPS